MGKFSYWEEFYRIIVRESKMVELTSREKEILKLISAGKTNLEIAKIMNLSIHTIKANVTCIFQKLNVKFRLQAVIKALEENLLEN